MSSQVQDTQYTAEQPTQQHYRQQPPPQNYQQPLPPPYGYGDPGYYGGMPRRGYGFNRGSVETRPFFLTSEFGMTLLGIILVAIVSATAEDVDSHLASMLIAGLVAAYTLSRGLAKSGTRSGSFDPRDELSLGRDHHSDH
jgi:hypothetical protein